MCLVEEAGAIPSVSLRPLVGMEALDVTVASSRAPSDPVALGTLLKFCSSWQRPGAVVQGQCILVSPAKFEVDIGYHVDAIAAFKQMPTKSYGRVFCFCFHHICYPRDEHEAIAFLIVFFYAGLQT